VRCDIVNLKRLSGAAAIVALLAVLTPANAQAQPPDNWGQEVKSCNQTNCYPEGSSRGKYVNGQAQDNEVPGYANEIHRLANPGKADPPPFQP
jgi:glucose-6-phosphate 1-dehydrogenase